MYVSKFLYFFQSKNKRFLKFACFLNSRCCVLLCCWIVLLFLLFLAMLLAWQVTDQHRVWQRSSHPRSEIYMVFFILIHIIRLTDLALAGFSMSDSVKKMTAGTVTRLEPIICQYYQGWPIRGRLTWPLPPRPQSPSAPVAWRWSPRRGLSSETRGITLKNKSIKKRSIKK